MQAEDSIPVEEINVTKEEQFATHRQIITPEGKETIVPILTTLHDVLTLGKFRGKMIVNYNQGGVTNIMTEHVANVRKGSAADVALEEEFGR